MTIVSGDPGFQVVPHADCRLAWSPSNCLLGFDADCFLRKSSTVCFSLDGLVAIVTRSNPRSLWYIQYVAMKSRNWLTHVLHPVDQKYTRIGFGVPLLRSFFKSSVVAVSSVTGAA